MNVWVVLLALACGYVLGAALNYYLGYRNGWLEGRVRLHDAYVREDRLRP